MSEPAGQEVSSHQNLVAWCWRKGGDSHLIVVNLSDSESQGRVVIPWDDVSGRAMRLTDAFTAKVYERDGNELRSQVFLSISARGDFMS